MKRNVLILTLAAVLIMVFALGGVLRAEDQNVPAVIILEDPAYEEYRKGPVELSHAKHTEEYGVACKDCHHVYEDGENVWEEGDPVEPCIECHPMQKNEGKLYKMRMGTAYHKNCRDCHKEEKKGPYRKCDECHAD